MVECAGVKVEMSRACCCSVSHADVILSITTIQDGWSAMKFAKYINHVDTISVLEQVVGEWVSECVCARVCMLVMCVCVIVCGAMCV